jgi:hypothetical protein
MKFFIVLLSLFILSCTKIYTIQKIDLGKEMANDRLQISGMDWYGDKLVLLIQIPSEFNSTLKYINKNEILNYLENDDLKIKVNKIYLEDKAVCEVLGNENEYEAITFNDENVYMMIERDWRGEMESWIVKGMINDNDSLVLDAATLKRIPIPKKIINEMACETITIIGDSVYAFYEANGANLNNPAYCFRFDFDLKEVVKIQMDYIEYRITDATMADGNNKFWVINNFYKGDLDQLDLAEDDLLPATRGSKENEVKRLIQLKLQDGKIKIADKNTVLLPPENWNWEALARLDNQGFLISNDTYAPKGKRTLLGFIAKEIE